MIEEKKEPGDEYLDPATNPMIRLDVPDASADEKDDVVGSYRAPYGPLSGDEAEAMATALLGKADTRIDDLGDGVEVTISRTADGLITINSRAPAEITDEDRRELMELHAQDAGKARDEKEASDDRDVNPKSNPMIRLDPPG